jgi:hypothetical protein
LANQSRRFSNRGCRAGEPKQYFYNHQKVISTKASLEYGTCRISSYSSQANSDEAGQRGSTSLRDSIVVEILNPKTVLFFVTFLPLFVDPAAAMPLWAQFLLLGFFVNLVFSVADIASVGIASLALVRLKDGVQDRCCRRPAAPSSSGLAWRSPVITCDPPENRMIGPAAKGRRGRAPEQQLTQNLLAGTLAAFRSRATACDDVGWKAHPNVKA